jgi:hypothetical protein
MVEALLVFGGVGLLALLGLVAPTLDPLTLLLCGAAITSFGLVAGVPTGFWYHVVLYRCLRPRGPLPARWWVHPVALHGMLLPSERPQVLRWFFAGGVGFVFVVIGCVVVITSVALQWLALRQ